MNFGISLPAYKHNQSTIAKDMSNADRYKREPTYMHSALTQHGLFDLG